MEQDMRKDFDREAAQWDANLGWVKIASDVVGHGMRESQISLMAAAKVQ